jgi:hypothetical protein
VNESLVRRMLTQLENRGLWIEAGAEPGSLSLCGPAKEKTPEVMGALKRFKKELLEIYNPAPKPPEPEYTPTAEPVAVAVEWDQSAANRLMEAADATI